MDQQLDARELRRPDGPRKADLLTGLGIAFFGLATIAVTLTFRWDLASVRQAGWYTAPGILPVGVAIILVLQGTLLSVHAARNGGMPEGGDVTRVRETLTSAPVRRAAVTAVLLAVYVFVLVGRLHFTLASFLFLAAFMFHFRAAAWWKTLLISAGAAAGISFLFEGLARVPLP